MVWVLFQIPSPLVSRKKDAAPRKVSLCLTDCSAWAFLRVDRGQGTSGTFHEPSAGQSERGCWWVLGIEIVLDSMGFRCLGSKMATFFFETLVFGVLGFLKRAKNQKNWSETSA